MSLQNEETILEIVSLSYIKLFIEDKYLNQNI